MGGYSERAFCPRCGADSLERSEDHDDVSGFCLECGYEYHTAFSVVTLEDVNEERANYELGPLTELRKPVDGWRD